MKDWFHSWFDSQYYHILYKERDDKEAELFLDNLIAYLKLPLKSKVLDIACGKGRHAIYLNKKGYIVTGIDLSKQSIDYCKEFENSHLDFHVHDMRNTFRTNSYDAALNLFTSFGYFENENDNLLALQSAANAVKEKGIVVLDFFNPEIIKLDIPIFISKTVDGITFRITKQIESGFIKKRIEFTDKEKEFLFTESVQLISLEKFKIYFEKSGLTILNTFGNYDLEKYIASESNRLIFVAQKK